MVTPSAATPLESVYSAIFLQRFPLESSSEWSLLAPLDVVTLSVTTQTNASIPTVKFTVGLIESVVPLDDVTALPLDVGAPHAIK